jgi:hypothetical protein
VSGILALMKAQEMNFADRARAGTAFHAFKASLLSDVVRRTNIRPTTITQYNSERIDLL